MSSSREAQSGSATLRPIPAVGEPFKRSCRLRWSPSKTKSGSQYILTIMCIATRFPEAIPLRKITAKSVTKALIHFFTFGLPKTIQTDQGSNFMSNVFKNVLKALKVSCRIQCLSSRVTGCFGAMASNFKVCLAEILFGD